MVKNKRKNKISEFPQNTYNGYIRHDFMFDENEVVIVEPKHPVPDRRWVWKAEFFHAFPAFDFEMLARGWWLAFINVGNTFGCPAAMKRFNAFYKEMTEIYKFDRRPVLEGMSRGGLYVYNWAVENTDEVGLVYGDNPVCDFKSWPGGKGRGPGSETDWNSLMKYYGFASETDAMRWHKNPVDNVALLVKAGIPLVHVYGDADTIVPWDENTKVMAENVEALGGRIKLFCKSGCDHHPHGPDNPAVLADWVIANVLGNET